MKFSKVCFGLGPDHGMLVDHLTGEQVTSFSLIDLHQDRLAYLHSGDNAKHDHVLLQVTDGDKTKHVLFNIEIKPKVSSHWHNNQ